MVHAFYYYDLQLLERREYFGQYGKVMKVSISRPTGAAAQQALANNTFSVYVFCSSYLIVCLYNPLDGIHNL
jgi:hypothetical protein